MLIQDFLKNTVIAIVGLLLISMCTKEVFGHSGHGPHYFYKLTWATDTWAGLTYVRHPETCETLKEHLVSQGIADRAFCTKSFALTAKRVTREVRRTHLPIRWHLWIRQGLTGIYELSADKADCQRYAQAARGFYDRAICFSETPRN